jgi:hypothetical protein
MLARAAAKHKSLNRKEYADVADAGLGTVWFAFRVGIKKYGASKSSLGCHFLKIATINSMQKFCMKRKRALDNSATVSSQNSLNTLLSC